MQQQLETSRLILRNWKDTDLEPYAQLNLDPSVMEHFPSLMSLDESEQSVGRVIKHFEVNDFGLWAAELKENGKFIGFIGLQRVPFEAAFTPAVEVGWRLAKEFWGQGLAPEGAEAAMKDAFDRIKLDEIVSMTTTTNKKSMRVMEKLGMTRDPLEDFDHPRVPVGPLQRHVLYRMPLNLWKTRSTNTIGLPKNHI